MTKNTETIKRLEDKLSYLFRRTLDKQTGLLRGDCNHRRYYKQQIDNQLYPLIEDLFINLDEDEESLALIWTRLAQKACQVLNLTIHIKDDYQTYNGNSTTEGVLDYLKEYLGYLSEELKAYIHALSGSESLVPQSLIEDLIVFLLFYNHINGELNSINKLFSCNSSIFKKVLSSECYQVCVFLYYLNTSLSCLDESNPFIVCRKNFFNLAQGEAFNSEYHGQAIANALQQLQTDQAQSLPQYIIDFVYYQFALLGPLAMLNNSVYESPHDELAGQLQAVHKTVNQFSNLSTPSLDIFCCMLGHASGFLDLLTQMNLLQDPIYLVDTYARLNLIELIYPLYNSKSVFYDSDYVLAKSRELLATLEQQFFILNRRRSPPQNYSQVYQTLSKIDIWRKVLITRDLACLFQLINPRLALAVDARINCEADVDSFLAYLADNPQAYHFVPTDFNILFENGLSETAKAIAKYLQQPFYKMRSLKSLECIQDDWRQLKGMSHYFHLVYRICRYLNVSFEFVDSYHLYNRTIYNKYQDEMLLPSSALTKYERIVSLVVFDNHFLQVLQGHDKPLGRFIDKALPTNYETKIDEISSPKESSALNFYLLWLNFIKQAIAIKQVDSNAQINKITNYRMSLQNVLASMEDCIDGLGFVNDEITAECRYILLSRAGQQALLFLLICKQYNNNLIADDLCKGIVKYLRQYVDVELQHYIDYLYYQLMGDDPTEGMNPFISSEYYRLNLDLSAKDNQALQQCYQQAVLWHTFDLPIYVIQWVNHSLKLNNATAIYKRQSKHPDIQYLLKSLELTQHGGAGKLILPPVTSEEDSQHFATIFQSFKEKSELGKALNLDKDPFQVTIFDEFETLLTGLSQIKAEQVDLNKCADELSRNIYCCLQYLDSQIADLQNCNRLKQAYPEQVNKKIRRIIEYQIKPCLTFQFPDEPLAFFECINLLAQCQYRIGEDKLNEAKTLLQQTSSTHFIAQHLSGLSEYLVATLRQIWQDIVSDMKANIKNIKLEVVNQVFHVYRISKNFVEKELNRSLNTHEFNVDKHINDFHFLSLDQWWAEESLTEREVPSAPKSNKNVTTHQTFLRYFEKSS